MTKDQYIILLQKALLQSWGLYDPIAEGLKIKRQIEAKS